MTPYFFVARLVLGEQQGLFKLYTAPRSKPSCADGTARAAWWESRSLLFALHGTVQTASVIKDKYSGESRGFGGGRGSRY